MPYTDRFKAQLRGARNGAYFMKSNCSRPEILRHGALALIAASSISMACGGTTTDKGAAPSKDAAPSGGNDWVTMGYDLQSTYHNTKETKLSKDNVKTLAPKWNAKIQAYGTPVVVGDVVYEGGGDGIYAFNANTGEQLWKFADGSAAAGASSSLTYENGILYFTAGSGGNIVALDTTKNPPTAKWDVNADDSRDIGFSSAIIAGDLIITGDSALDAKRDVTDPTLVPYMGSVVAVHKSDGSPAWKTPTGTPPEDGCAVWGTVSIDPVEKLVYVPVGNNYNVAGPGSDSVLCLNLGDGSVKWRKQVTTGDIFNLTNFGPGKDYDFGANPVVFDYNGKKLVAGGQKSGTLYVWDRVAGGDPIVTRSLGGGTSFIGGVFQGLAFDGQHLITVCNTATSTNPGGEPANGDSSTTSVLYGLVPDTLDIAYERQLGAWVWSPVTIANGVGYLGEETRLEAFDAATGDMLFQYQVLGTIASGVTVSDGRVFFGSGLNYIFGHKDGSFQSLALP